MQEPGILHKLKFFMLSDEERQIVENLSKLWFISFVKKQSFKNVDYSFVFAKPSDLIAEQFHLSREVLIIFSQYTTFSGRTLDFVDKLMNDYSNRLDKLCVVLVSNDKQLENKIANIILQDKESRILIPYRYDELKKEKDTESFQMSKLKKSFYERDLFAYETPLKSDTYFFGRQTLIKGLYGKYQTGQCGALFGLRRIGKTSSLFAVIRMMKLRDEPAVYIDCSEPALHQRRWNEALHFIIRELAKTLDLVDSITLHREDEYSEKNASICFESDLDAIFKSKNKKRILIIMDEIENITFNISPSNHWKDSLDFILFWQVFRSLFQKRSELFSFFLAGVNPKAIETPLVLEYDNPIYRFIKPNYLPFFDAQDVSEMVSTIGAYMGMSFDDEVYTYLTDDFGGHPFLIRQVCSKLFERANSKRPTVITKYFYEAHRDELNRGVRDYLDLIILVLRERYPEEYDMISYLAVGEYKTFRELVDISPLLIEHLIGYGLIEEDNGSFHFRIKSIEEYIKTVTKIRAIPSTREEKWLRICELRNTYEVNLRTLVKRTLKYRLGEVEAKNVFIAIVSPQSRQKQLEQLEFDEIFKAHLYFEDLRKVIEKNWSEFELIFNKDKGKFKLYMEFVNKSRADAHANDINDEDMAILEIAINWLVANIEKYLD